MNDMDNRAVAEYIAGWMKEYLAGAHSKGFVVGISGGIDSAVVSVLAAMTGMPVLCVSLPIHQPQGHLSRAEEHICLLMERFDNVKAVSADLSRAFDTFMASCMEAANAAVDNAGIGAECSTAKHIIVDTAATADTADTAADIGRAELTAANTRSRLRMAALYYFAGMEGFLVAGTGNKIEDFGVGFFTKYGDGGVDISPIGDLTKSEVFALGRYLGLAGSVLEAAPSDGLFDDDRSDEQQIGATYPELEWAMEQAENGTPPECFTGRRREVYDIYLKRHRANLHKMSMPPVCIIPEGVKG